MTTGPETTASRPQVSEVLLAQWRASEIQYQVIAAGMTAWAKGREHGTALPGNDHFAGDLPFVAGWSTFRRAKKLLQRHGVLYQDDGPWQVA